MCILRGLLVILSVSKPSLAKINLQLYFHGKKPVKRKYMFINLHTFLYKSGMITFCCNTSLSRQFQTDRVPKAEKLSKTASIKIALISR